MSSAVFLKTFSRRATPPILTLGLTACDPMISLEGSFWPAWIVCILAGLAAAIALMWLLARLRLAAHMGPPLLIAPSLWALCTFALWLVFFSN